MSASQRNAGDLPEELEEAVLAVLEGDEAVRSSSLRALLTAWPQHAATLRAWLGAAGVAVPRVVTRSGEAAAADDAEALPLQLGHYVLTELLGRGGFGSVYRAEQQEPIEREVAVKVLNPGMDSRDVLARFGAEREALNRMNHPGIARLLDAGTTPRGRPFFVMELVDGPPLIAHCRRRHLPLRARLQLFLRVLDAMQHAHQKAVVHRDLSSNNVLVADPDGNPQPKIIDFGIAKSLSSPLLDGGAVTLKGDLMGTPEFMSPEQAGGHVADLDTRADVYALGVQLYELLTDQLPIPRAVLMAKGYRGLADIVRRHVPPRPSEVAPRDRRSQLRGDLDAIVMQALAKSPDERYAAVGALADDIRRYLADEPIQVGTPSRWYRLRKFVRRHRTQSALVTAVLLGLGGAFWAMASSLQLAERRAAELREANHRAEQQMMRDFDVLMIDENLLLAAASEHQLPPPWPQHAAAYADWLAQHTSLLASARDQLAAIHRSLAVTGTDALRLSPANRQLLLRTLDRLTTRLDDFATGPLARVQRRHALLTEVIAPATAGMDNSVPSGLLPLGRNPTTGLAEFLDLASHGEAHPPPQRDEASGQLVLDGATGIVFVALPASYFALGARRDQPGMARYDEHAADDELGQESVALDAFLLAATELTEAQWARLRGPGTPIDDPLLPATNLDHHEATRVLHGYGMVLPTEAQWEYACRAGAFSPAGRGNEPELARQLAQRGSDPRHLVGVLGPNGFGLYDMLGNVAEWCAEPKLAYPTSRARRGDGWRQPTWSLVIEPPIAVRGMRLPGGDLRATMRHGLPATHRDLSLGVRPARPLPR